MTHHGSLTAVLALVAACGPLPTAAADGRFVSLATTPLALECSDGLLALAITQSDEPHIDSEAHGSSQAELATKLQNPVANLISVPLQFNTDFGYPSGGSRTTLNVQPVIPFSLNDEWGLISRTIIPIVYQDVVVPDEGSQFGMGDITQSLFLSPKKPGEHGWIWGAGPVLLIPTSTDDLLGSGKFGLGPTGLLLRQHDGFTYGMLANHIWSVAGDGGRADVNATFLQPFFSYTTHTAFTLGINLESTYDWTGEQWTVPINLFASQVMKLGDQPVSFTLGARYYAESPDNGPEWGFRFVVTFLFPG